MGGLCGVCAGDDLEHIQHVPLHILLVLCSVGTAAVTNDCTRVTVLHCASTHLLLSPHVVVSLAQADAPSLGDALMAWQVMCAGGVG